MKYAPLIELHLRHSYSSDGRCRDFAISPTASTAQQVQNHRCLLRIEADSVCVLVPITEAGGPLIPTNQPLVLRFELTLQNSDFLDYTDFSFMPAHRAPWFTPASDGTAEAGSLSVAAMADPTHTAARFAAIELPCSIPAAAATPSLASYFLQFQAKRMRWAYYCLTHASTDASALHIVDASPSGTADILNFSDSNRRILSADPDPSDEMGMQLLSQYPGLRCVRFVSDALVACQQQPRKYLELRLGEERVVSPLPNPSPRSAVGGSLLFRVIKYRTQPLSTQ